MSAEQEPTPEPVAEPVRAPRISALDSEALRIDDRIFSVEGSLDRMTKDIFTMRAILIDQLVTVAFVELALAAVIVMLVLEYRKKREAEDG